MIQYEHGAYQEQCRATGNSSRSTEMNNPVDFQSSLSSHYIASAAVPKTRTLSIRRNYSDMRNLIFSVNWELPLVQSEYSAFKYIAWSQDGVVLSVLNR